MSGGMSIKVTFVPSNVSFEAEEKSKLLAVALKNKVKIQYGCASCRCGTCGVAIRGGGLSPMKGNEQQLLERMKLPLDGSVRLACQARVESGEVVVDLDFQGTYSPDQGDDDF
jgi:ferredoxin